MYSMNGNDKGGFSSEVIIDAVSAAILRSFGGRADIYADFSVIQGASLPAFFITLESQSQRRVNMRRYLSDNRFLITYYPEHSGNYKEMREVSEALFGVLEFITTGSGDVLAACGMKSELSGECIRFYADYSYFFIKREDSELMESFETVPCVGDFKPD